MKWAPGVLVVACLALAFSADGVAQDSGCECRQEPTQTLSNQQGREAWAWLLNSYRTGNAESFSPEAASAAWNNVQATPALRMYWDESQQARFPNGRALRLAQTKCRFVDHGPRVLAQLIGLVRSGEKYPEYSPVYLRPPAASNRPAAGASTAAAVDALFRGLTAGPGTPPVPELRANLPVNADDLRRIPSRDRREAVDGPPSNPDESRDLLFLPIHFPILGDTWTLSDLRGRWGPANVLPERLTEAAFHWDAIAGPMDVASGLWRARMEGGDLLVERIELMDVTFISWLFAAEAEEQRRSYACEVMVNAHAELASSHQSLVCK